MAGDRRGGGRPSLTRRQRRQVTGVVEDAERTTGLQFCVYLGPSHDDSRAHAERLFTAAGLHTRPAVLVLVAPPQRRVEVVTASEARSRIADADARLAVEAMTAKFAAGDLVGGIVAGIRELAAAAGPGFAPPGGEELPDVIGDADDGTEHGGDR